MLWILMHFQTSLPFFSNSNLRTSTGLRSLMLGSRFEFGFDGTKKHQHNCRAKKKKMHPMHMRCLPVIWLTHYVWSMKHISEQGWLNFNGIFAIKYWSVWCHKIWCLLIRIKSGWWYCWWFRNPANQLRLVVEIPMIYSYRVSETSQVGFRRISEPSTVSFIDMSAPPGMY